MPTPKSPPAEPLFPGAPQNTAAGLIHGVYALCTLSNIGTLHLFDFEIKVTQKLIEVTAHGDEWEQWIPLRQGWTGRARGYLSRAAAATATYIGGAAKISASPAAGTFIGYSDFGTTIIFQGEIYAEDITLQFPNAMVEQEITFRGSMAPTTGPTA